MGKEEETKKVTPDGSKKLGKKKRKWPIWLAIIIVILIIAGCAVAYYLNDKENKRREGVRAEIIATQKFHDGVSVNGVNIGGMSYADAERALAPVIDEISKEINIKVYDGTKVYNLDARKLGIKFNTTEVLDTAFGLAKDGSYTQLTEELDDIKLNGRKYELDYSFTDVIIKSSVAEIAADAKVEPVNASMEVNPEYPATSTEPFNVVESVDGSYLEEDKLTSEIIKKCSEKDFSNITVTPISVPAEITSENIKGKIVLRSSATTSFAKSPYYKENRVHNMRKASGMINGTVLMPGEEFSTNGILGDRLEKYGWLPAAAVVDGGAASEDQPGGGVCQISTTLYNAVLKGDLQVTSRRGHSSKLGYVDGGLDATITTVTGYIDFKWMNNTESPLYIFMWLDENSRTVYCEIYGEPFSDEFDEIKLKSEFVEDIEPTETEYVKTSRLSEGQWAVKNKAKTGHVYDSFKLFYKNGQLVKTEKVATTTYRMHPQRLWVWNGYVPGTPLDPAMKVTLETP